MNTLPTAPCPTAADIVALRIRSMSLRAQTIEADVALMQAALAALLSPALAWAEPENAEAIRQLRARIANHQTLYKLTRETVAAEQAKLRALSYKSN